MVVRRKRRVNSQFADTTNRRFPIDNIAHARASLASLSRNLRSGKISAREESRFRRRAREALDRLETRIGERASVSRGQIRSRRGR